MKKGFYSSYFIVPKKSGGLRPILDLRALNWALHKIPLKILTLKHILRFVRDQDWFVAVDLKDAYFYVSILSRHRPFLRFAFEGQALQYKVLPFGLSLLPCMFTKIEEAALAPLREVGICILDDWLILAHSRELCGTGLGRYDCTPVSGSCTVSAEVRESKFKAASSLTAFQRLLGHMPSSATVTLLGLMHMRLLQHWLQPEYGHSTK
ncbi:hypothetical protein M9458_030622, partial [Cirrhinus mrigala]